MSDCARTESSLITNFYKFSDIKTIYDSLTSEDEYSLKYIKNIIDGEEKISKLITTLENHLGNLPIKLNDKSLLDAEKNYYEDSGRSSSYAEISKKFNYKGPIINSSHVAISKKSSLIERDREFELFFNMGRNPYGFEGISLGIRQINRDRGMCVHYYPKEDGKQQDINKVEINFDKLNKIETFLKHQS